MISEYVGLTEELKGSLEAILIGKEGARLAKFPVSELVDKLKTSEGVQAVVFDGIVTGRLIDAAVQKGVKAIVGDRIAEGVKIPTGMGIKAFKDLQS